MTVVMKRKGTGGKPDKDVATTEMMLPPLDGYMWFRGALLHKPEPIAEKTATNKRVQIDVHQVELMALLLCSTTEIGEWYGLSKRALYYRMTVQPELRMAFRRGRIGALQRIRAKQMEVATTHGDVRMLIHLGKQYLGQFDRVPLPADAEIIDEGLEFANMVGEEDDAEIDGILENLKDAAAEKAQR